jgi:hypothetical protein
MLEPDSSVVSGAGAWITTAGFAIWVAFTGVAWRGVLGTAIGVCSVSRTCGVIFLAFQNWVLAHSAGVEEEFGEPLMQYQLGRVLSFFNKCFPFFGNYLRFLNEIRDIDASNFRRVRSPSSENTGFFLRRSPFAR